GSPVGRRRGGAGRLGRRLRADDLLDDLRGLELELFDLLALALGRGGLGPRGLLRGEIGGLGRRLLSGGLAGGALDPTRGGDAREGGGAAPSLAILAGAERRIGGRGRGELAHRAPEGDGLDPHLQRSVA